MNERLAISGIDDTQLGCALLLGLLAPEIRLSDLLLLSNP